MSRNVLWLVGCIGVAVMCAACPRDVRTRLPHEPSESTGMIHIILTRPASDLTVTVNGRLVTSRAHTRSVHVSGVPIGNADVVIAAGAGSQRIERHVRVDVDQGKVHTIPLASPDQSWLATAVAVMLSIGVWIVSQAVYASFF